MEPHDWLNEVTDQLRLSGTSLAYQRRLLNELQDHIEDLYCDERNHAMSAEMVGKESLQNRLGTPQEIASAAKEKVARARFAQRHPLVTYLVLPIPMLILAWFVYTLALAGVFSLFENYRDTAWAVNLAGTLAHSMAYVPAVILAVLITWVALRSETQIKWWLAATVLVAFVSALMMVSVTMPTAPGTGTLQVGVGFPPPRLLAGLAQFLVPLSVALAMFGYAAHRKRSAELSTD